MFNSASKQYIKEQKIDALRTLDKGLREYPGDPRMLELARELLKEQQQQQQQQQQEQEENKEEQRKDQQQSTQEEQKQGDDKGKEQREAQREPGRIDPQDAKRILDALQREEKDVQSRVRAKQRPTERRTIDRDW